MSTVTEVQSASFALVLHAQHILANSFNFLVTRELLVAVFHSTWWHCTGQHCSSIYACTYHLPVSHAPWWVLLQCSITLGIFFIVECGITCFLCAMQIFDVQASSSSPRLPSCEIFFYFATSIAELAHAEKLRTQSVTHPAYLMPREPKLALRNIPAASWPMAKIQASN